jgi:predicted subunit of tRNA(5-methylaminomethyl-2-thiouridylate) methyltransferase
MSNNRRDDEIPIVSVREIRQLQDYVRREVVPGIDRALSMAGLILVLLLGTCVLILVLASIFVPGD